LQHVEERDDLNLYAYTGNDPLNDTDPTGEDCIDLSTGPCETVTIHFTRPAPVTGNTIVVPIPALVRLPWWRAIGTTAAATAAEIFGDMLLSDCRGDSGPLPNCKGSNTMASKDQGKKKPRSGVSGKQGAKDVPSWAKGERPNTGESGKEFADRLLDQKYGKGNYPTGPGSEHSKI
jgi:hypothetical protein